MPKNPIDEAIGGLNNMADAALMKKLKKAKGLIQEAIDAAAGEEAAEGESLGDDAELSALAEEMGGD